MKLNEVRNNAKETKNHLKKEVHKVRTLRGLVLPWFLVVVFLIILILSLNQVKESYRAANGKLTKENQDTQQNLENLQNKYKDLKTLFDKRKTEIDKKIQDLQSKKEAAIVVAVASVKPNPTRTVQRVRSDVVPKPTTHYSIVNTFISPTTAHQIMLKYWGEDQWLWFDRLIKAESGYKNQWNKAGSGACGIGQSYPCSKMRLGIETPLTEQVDWMCLYIKNRYGTPYNAMQYHYAHNSY